MSSDLAKIRSLMLELLARREHSAAELERKLKGRGYNPHLIATVLTQLDKDNLQSDRRFTESYIHSRIARGFGPRRIALELKSRGINNTLINDGLTKEVDDWNRQAREVRSKRFGQTLPSSPKEQAQQKRFLLYRGFTHEQVNGAVRDRDN